MPPKGPRENAMPASYPRFHAFEKGYAPRMAVPLLISVGAFLICVVFASPLIGSTFGMIGILAYYYYISYIVDKNVVAARIDFVDKASDKKDNNEEEDADKAEEDNPKTPTDQPTRSESKENLQDSGDEAGKDDSDDASIRSRFNLRKRNSKKHAN